MKKILAALSLAAFLLATSAHADTCSAKLTGTFTSFQATKLCGTFVGSATISSTITPGADNSYDVGTALAGFRSGYFDTSVLTPLLIPPGDLQVRVDADAQRLINAGASSDTAIYLTWGDTGTTAVQNFAIRATTSDADDDSTLYACGGGAYAADGSRGACILLPGEEVAGGSDISYVAGGGDTHAWFTGSTATATLDATGVFTAAAGLVATAGGVTATAGNVAVTAGNLTFGAASAKVIPGATSLLFRDTADAQTNLGITDAGVVTARAGLVATAGGLTATAGDIVASASGATLRLQEATAGAKCMGTVTANGVTAVPVATTCVLTASRIFISRTSAVAAGVTEPGCWAANIVNATSFDLDCNDAAEDSTFNWFIINESA